MLHLTCVHIMMHGHHLLRGIECWTPFYALLTGPSCSNQAVDAAVLQRSICHGSRLTNRTHPNTLVMTTVCGKLHTLHISCIFCCCTAGIDSESRSAGCHMSSLMSKCDPSVTLMSNLAEPLVM